MLTPVHILVVKRRLLEGRAGCCCTLSTHCLVLLNPLGEVHLLHLARRLAYWCLKKNVQKINEENGEGFSQCREGGGVGSCG